VTDKRKSNSSKLPQFVRMLGSCSDGEAVNTVRAMRNIGTDFHAMADLVAGKAPAADQGEIVRAYERGRAQGRFEAARENNDHDGFEGHSWAEIAKFCAANPHRLGNDFELKFCPSVAKWARHSSLSEKQ
jgi:hypothetical protein